MVSSSGATQDEIRRRNVSTLLRQVHVQGQLSRAQLTALMGLNRSTIKTLVGDLCEAGLVAETIPETGLRAGRPSHLVGPRADTAYVLTANLGVETVTAAAVGLGGIINARSEYRLPGPGVDHGTVIDRLADELRTLSKSVQPGAWLAGVGVGVPGAIRQADGFVEFAPNLGWRGVPFGELLSKRLGLPVQTRVGNDGDLGGLAEHVRGAGRGIGREIALRCARDGAKVVITGKTVKPHAKLPGTTFVRGMIRSYAKLVQLDPQPLLVELGRRDLPAAVTVDLRTSGQEPFLEGGKKSNRIYVLLSMAALLAVEPVVARATKELLQQAPGHTLEQQSAAERRAQAALQRTRLAAQP